MGGLPSIASIDRCSSTCDEYNSERINMKTHDEVEQQMQSLGWWYLHFAFPNRVRTGTGQEPGYDAETRWNLIKPFVPEELKGKTVLDLGGNCGYFSIQMKLRGLKAVWSSIRLSIFSGRQILQPSSLMYSWSLSTRMRTCTV